MKHLLDQTLLLLLDGELTAADAGAAAAHLASCAACRRSRDLLVRTMDAMPDGTVPAANDAARAMLVRRLARAAKERPVTWLRPRLVLHACLLALTAVLGLAVQQLYHPLQDGMAAYEQTGPEPNRELTPGTVRTAAVGELCAMPDDNLDPVVDRDKQSAVFEAYGLNTRERRAYQVDYLINPQLGGNDDLRNLWPEPYHATVWNAAAKDALEARLHGLVCSGQIGLADAQRELATDWIGTYKRVFHAERPVRVQASAADFELR